VQFGAERKHISKTTELGARAANACVALLFVVCAFFAVGCKRRESHGIDARQIHEITQELAKAISDAAPGGTLIRTRHAPGGSSGTSVDDLRVRIRGERTADRIRQAVEGVATRHSLTVDPEKRSGERIGIALRSRGHITHRIEIEWATPAEAQSAGKFRPGQPRLAILLDDLGSDRAAAEAIFALRLPVTISVLPYHEHSHEIAQAAKQHGCEVMLHLPMESVANQSPEQQELRPGLSRAQVKTVVEKMLEEIPEADGVNNHQGSQATADPALMQELMQVLKDDGIFYVDSRTTANTVAYETAQREGVKAAFRNVPFLDDLQDKTAVKKQLRLAIEGARQKGEAIAIGHPHAATLDALREMLPQAKKDGIQLVFVSELVK